MKNNKREMLLTSLVCLLPLLAGVALYPRLPETMATHWGFDGTANGWAQNVFAHKSVRLRHFNGDFQAFAEFVIIKVKMYVRLAHPFGADAFDAVDLSRDVAAWQCAHAWHGAGL